MQLNYLVVGFIFYKRKIRDVVNREYPNEVLTRLTVEDLQHLSTQLRRYGICRQSEDEDIR